MTSYLQTITVEFPSSQRIFLGMEVSPICPPSYKTEEGAPFIVMRNTENCLIIWWNNGIIVKGYPDGLTKTWYPKVSQKDALLFSIEPTNKKGYFEFHNDGSVSSSIGHINYYWSAPVPGLPETGAQVFGYLYDENEYTDEELEQRGCGLCHDSAF